MLEIVRMRALRMTYREIGERLGGLNHKSVYESHQRAKKYLYKELPEQVSAEVGVSVDELARFEELEFADARIRDLLEIADLCTKKESYFNAIQAIKATREYVEMIIKVRGIAAPERHEVAFTIEQVKERLRLVEAEVGPVSEAEVLAFDLNQKRVG